MSLAGLSTICTPAPQVSVRSSSTRWSTFPRPWVLVHRLPLLLRKSNRIMTSRRTAVRVVAFFSLTWGTCTWKNMIDKDETLKKHEKTKNITNLRKVKPKYDITKNGGKGALFVFIVSHLLKGSYTWKNMINILAVLFATLSSHRLHTLVSCIAQISSEPKSSLSFTWRFWFAALSTHRLRTLVSYIAHISSKDNSCRFVWLVILLCWAFWNETVVSFTRRFRFGCFLRVEWTFLYLHTLTAHFCILHNTYFIWI